ncbi:MAG: TatD family hydrolase [archaeon]
MFIDVHCHASMFEDVEKEIENAKNANVKLLISNSVDFASMEKNLEIAKKHKEIKILLGLHPEEVIKMQKDEIEEAFEFIEKNITECIGIGETGLDYKYAETKEQREVQRQCFARHIEIAKKHNLAIEIHSRRAQNVVLDMLEKAEARNVLLHWFYADTKTVKKAASMDYFISVGPSIISNESLKPIIEEYPIEKILFETDCPAVLFDGERVNPTWIARVAQKVAEIKGISLQEIEKISENNAKNLFSSKLNI